MTMVGQGIASLPQELLEAICDHFSSPTIGWPALTPLHEANRRVLYSLTKVNKRFYGLATPMLYRNLHIDRRIFSREPHEAHYALSLVGLFSTLSKSSNIARLVKTVHLTFNDTHESFARKVTRTIIPANQTRSVPPGLRVQIRKLLQKGHVGALVMLLLTLCTEIEKIASFPNLFNSPHVIRFVERAIARLQPRGGAERAHRPLARLREVVSLFQILQVVRGDFQSHLNGTLALLRAPALESLQGCLVPRRLADYQDFAVRYRSNLRRLNLHYSLLSAAELEQLFLAFPVLTELLLDSTALNQSQRRHPGLPSDAPLGSPHFGDVLHRHGSRLQRFALRCWSGHPSTLRSEACVHRGSPVGPLRHMTDLRFLSYEWEVLCGPSPATCRFYGACVESAHLVDVLPTSLRELWVVGVDWLRETTEFERCDGQLGELMRSERFDALRSIRFNRETPFSGPLPAGWYVSGGVEGGRWDSASIDECCWELKKGNRPSSRLQNVDSDKGVSDDREDVDVINGDEKWD